MTTGRRSLLCYSRLSNRSPASLQTHHILNNNKTNSTASASVERRDASKENYEILLRTKLSGSYMKRQDTLKRKRKSLFAFGNVSVGCLIEKEILCGGYVSFGGNVTSLV